VLASVCMYYGFLYLVAGPSACFCAISYRAAMNFG
jgi:hypothetical protein